jgi:nickel-dependent lactate racemase
MSSDAKSPSLFCNVGSETTALSDDDLRNHIYAFLDSVGEREDVLILPPDYTRFHSQAGKLTQMVAEYYNFIPSAPTTTDPPRTKKIKSSNEPTLQILPALGTHAPMSEEQIKNMFGEKLASKEPSPFLVHDWRNDVETIGHAPKEMVRLFLVFWNKL